MGDSDEVEALGGRSQDNLVLVIDRPVDDALITQVHAFHEFPVYAYVVLTIGCKSSSEQLRVDEKQKIRDKKHE